LFKKIRRFLSRFKILRKIYWKLIGYNPDWFRPTVDEVTPYSARRLDELGNNLRLNLILPTIDKSYIFGGIATAVHFFDELCNEMHANKRIIISNLHQSEDLHVFNKYLLNTSSEDLVDDFQIVPYCDRNGKTIPVGKNDIFIATAWWTAYCILPIIKWQAKTYSRDALPLLYLVQDYEPGFYQWSSRQILAESTYKSQLPVIAVFNTSLLKDYFHQQKLSFFKEYFFEPALNKKLKQLLPQGTIKKKRQILIYGRPATARNGFELIVDALRIWSHCQPDYRDWIVVSAGEKFPDVHINDDLMLKSVGKLTLEEYAHIMTESYIGISIMISPHPSYPPLEMSTFGVKVITNNYANKNLAGFNDNIISLENYSPDCIAEELLKLCSSFNPDAKSAINDKYLTDNEIFGDITKQINIVIKNLL